MKDRTLYKICKMILDQTSHEIETHADMWFSRNMSQKEIDKISSEKWDIFRIKSPYRREGVKIGYSMNYSVLCKGYPPTDYYNHMWNIYALDRKDAIRLWNLYRKMVMFKFNMFKIKKKKYRQIKEKYEIMMG